MKWILILTLIYGYNGSSSMTSIAFDDLAACELAAKRWLEQNKFPRHISASAVCTPSSVPNVLVTP